MDQWLDSLSEDWVSQPRSPHSSSILQESVLRDTPSPGGNASQSRIPRYKPRSVSGPSTASVKEAGRASSVRRSSQMDGALREKTSSKMNASHKSNGQSKSRTTNAGSLASHGRKASTSSISGIAPGTVQHKSSPAKERHLHGTPEWKRRVLKENAGGDLFGPIGLESVFKPPTVNHKPQAKPAGKRKLSPKETISSSPPLTPAFAKKNSKVLEESAGAPANKIISALGTQIHRGSEEDVRDQSLPFSSHVDPKISAAGNQTSITPAGSKSLDEPELPLLSPPGSEPLVPHRSIPSVVSNGLDHTGLFSDRSRNEEISPFYVSKQGTVDGGVEYAAIDMSMQRLRSQMDKMRLQQQNIPTSRLSENGIGYVEARDFENSARREQLNEVTSQSLPDDLSMGTDAYAVNGGFVTLRRGGYSNDGSFLRRPVSPSLLPDLDGPSLRVQSLTQCGKVCSPELPQNFSQTKSRTPSSPPPSSILQTPNNHKHQRSNSDDRPRSSGSPLKLFDKHDTFTNERLIRRMSKFEETLHHNPQEDSNTKSTDGLLSSPSPRRRRPYKQDRTDTVEENPVGRRISSFGDGELNGHPFPLYKMPDIAPRTAGPFGDGKSQANSFQFDRSVSYGREGSNRAKDTRNHSQIAGDSSWRGQEEDHSSGVSQKNDSDWDESKNFQEPIRSATGKRLPYSPAKNPAAKRRRTLLTSEAHPNPQAYPQAQEIPVQPVSGRKRKDARYDSNRQAADPSTLATRHIRLPRVPITSQTGYPGNPNKVTSISQVPNGMNDESLPLNEKNIAIVDPPTQIVAGALATIALNTAHEVTYGSRKASVTTADFFNEAQQIMQLIRAKGPPRSSHATTEGSEVGPPTIVEESFVEDSTKDQFSRPPSREGSPHRLEKPARLDARAVSHLRKFEDDQDVGFALSSSLKALKIAGSRRQSDAAVIEHEKDNTADSGAESDPPNVRIRDRIVQNHKRKYSSSTNALSVLESENHNGSQHTNPTSGSSSSQSNPTGSSHSSTNRMIIAPETVAHLLSDQMAGMVFDRQKQLWVKRKSSPNVEYIDQRDQTTSEGTEEDLFADIPDLSVDEMEELQRVKDAVSSVKSMGSATDRVSIHDRAVFSETQRETSHHIAKEEDPRPRTAEGKSVPIVDNSSAPSKFSHFASSVIQPGTRATSWGDEAFQTKEPQLPTADHRPDLTNLENRNEEQVEHEFSIFEGRESYLPDNQRHRKHQARVVTVAFSSPLVEHREPDLKEDSGSDSGEGESELSLDNSPVRYGSQALASAKRSVSSVSARKLGRHCSSRRMSINNQSYLTRPMSRLDEEDEMSIIHYSVGNRHMSMEVAITTPLPVSKNLLLPSSGGRSSVGFHLSPLPDFTVHQTDKPIDGDPMDIAKRLSSGKVENKLSLAAQDLVKNLTDLEPYEPYWDYLRAVDLHNRNLGTLHMLTEFCGRVEELNVSDNQIRELNGIPNTVRQLNLRDNRLSDLAAWDSLQNLQYLDVSGNKISSLQGFQNLFHLRSLRADDNEIKSINGLEDLNGLTSLSLRGNKLRVVDFENCDLQRLTKLDLCDNELVSVLNLHQLPVLESCKLSNNDLEALDFAISVPLSRLEALDFSGNRLSFIDLAEIPKLKTLKLDRNSIATIESLSRLKYLETLSWREQILVPAYGFSEAQYQHCHEVHDLCLSGNAISTFAPWTPFLNLQNLELASTGLQSLSSDFGLRCPNLRTVNLNYNAIRDLRPLLGVVKLQMVFIAGNRVSRLRRTAAVLDRIGKDILEIDLRNNPLTVGFYTPQSASREEKQLVPRSDQNPIEDEETEARDAQAYLLPALDNESDERSKERLDEDTKLRRRVYEMLVINSCKRLERLDGLEVNRRNVGNRDGVWERLVELGVLKEKDAKH